MNQNLVLLVLLILTTSIIIIKESLGAIDFVDPPSGSVIANFEDTANASTIVCNISHGGRQISTQWTVANFRGDGPNVLYPFNIAPELFSAGGDPIPNTDFLFNNELTFLTWAAELDRVIVYCGTGQDPQQASFTLRIYRLPRLQDDFLVKIEEGSRNITVDLRQDPTAFPEPTLFSWSKDGQPLSATTELTLTYSSVTIDTVRRADAGNYTVTATNFVLSGSPAANQVGNGTGSFCLDVIYGPSLALGPPQYYVLLGDSASLVCGTGLDSNPQATITWTAPDGTIIMNSARFNLENGPDIVRLNLCHTLLGDSGMWRCDIRTESEQDIVNNGKLVPTNITAISERIRHDIELIIIAPPGQPRTFLVKESEATSLQVCWEAPVQSGSHISYYILSICNLNNTQSEGDKVIANTISNETFYSVTGLLPGTTYELTVVAVSQGGDVIALSQASIPIIHTTGVTVPALTCNASANDIIMVTWSYIHTGGLPLINVSMSYTFRDEFTISRPVPVSISSVYTTRITVPNLEAGYTYTFNVTSQNRVGATSALCGVVISTSDQSATENNITAIIVGGVIGGLAALMLIIGFATFLTILCLRKKGKGEISHGSTVELVYDYPNSLHLQEYRPMNDRDIELNECPAYEKPNKQPEIELVNCPAYNVEKQRSGHRTVFIESLHYYD